MFRLNDPGDTFYILLKGLASAWIPTTNIQAGQTMLEWLQLGEKVFTNEVDVSEWQGVIEYGGKR